MAKEFKESIMPIYVALDTSESMGRASASREGKTRIEIVSGIISLFRDEMKYDSTFKESVWINVLGFNETVTEIVRKGDYAKLEEICANEEKIKNQCEGQTYYSVLFKKLKELISADIAEIVKSGKQFYRPLIYFLTDGLPYGDDEEKIKTEYMNLVTNRGEQERYNPVILCIGTGEATFSELSKYGAGRNYKEDKPNFNAYRYANRQYAWQIRKGVDEKEALETMNRSIISAIKNSLVPDGIDLDTVNERDLETNIGKGMGRPRVNKRLNELFETEHLGAKGKK